MSYVFDRDFTYDLFPLNPLSREYEDMSSVTSAPTIYIFGEDEKPTYAQAQAGTGAIATISTWVDVELNGNHGKRISIDGIADPEPDSHVERRLYWLGINYKLDPSEATVTLVRALPLIRATLHDEPVSTSRSDLSAIYKDISVIASDDQQDDAIVKAISLIRQELEADGFLWAKIWRPKELNDAVAFKALSMIMFGEMAQTGDRYNTLAMTYKESAGTLLSGLKLEMSDRAIEEPSEISKSPLSSIIVMR